MIRPELIDVLASYNAKLAETEHSNWEKINSKGADRDQVVQWYARLAWSILALVPDIDSEASQEWMAIGDVVLRLHRCTERLGISPVEIYHYEGPLS